MSEGSREWTTSSRERGRGRRRNDYALIGCGLWILAVLILIRMLRG